MFSPSLSATIVVQHLVGLAMAAPRVRTRRRIGAGRWTALVPAAIVALSGDQLYFEHTLPSDGLFGTLLLLTCYCALRVT